MKSNYLLSKLGIIISFASLFFVATYFGKAVGYTDGFLFTFGLLLGMGLLEIDETVLFKYYVDQESVDTKKRLVTRSLLFILLLFPLGLFLLTSTGSAIGVGMFLSILSGLSLEFFLLRKNRAGFQERFLHQLKREITDSEHQLFTTFFIGATILYGFFVIFLGR